MKTDALFELLGNVDDDLVSAAHEKTYLKKGEKQNETNK